MGFFKSGGYRWGGDAQGLRYLVHGHALVMIEKDGLQQFPGQLHHLDGEEAVILRKRLGGFGQVIQRDGSFHIAEPGGFPHVLAGVDGDAHEPGFLAALLSKALKTLIGFQKGLLHRVLGQGQIPEVEEAHAQEGLFIPIDDALKPTGFAAILATNSAHVSSPPSPVRRQRARVC